MRAGLVIRRFQRSMCMVGIHRFGPTVNRCLQPGCRAQQARERRDRDQRRMLLKKAV